MKIVSIIGTRPEIIKLSPVFDLLDEKFQHKIIHTGQHYDPILDRDLFRELKLKSKVIRLGTGPGAFGEQFARQISAVFSTLVKEKPELIVVQGDTNSALTGALAGARLTIPVIHIEAGCRSGNIHAPEEQNRLLIDSISRLHLCPDRKTFKNLAVEGHKKSSLIVGSTTFDALERSTKLISRTLLQKNPRGKFVICTLHRAETLTNEKKLREKINFINWLSSHTKVIFPIHPHTQKVLKKFKIHLSPDVITRGPMSHLEFLAHLQECRLVVSDSGGIQEEAAFFHRPCLVLREETEWTRLIKAGMNFLLPKTGKKAKDLTLRLLEDEDFYQKVRARSCPENKTGAAAMIVKKISSLRP
jgi:UDP-N-acetylglucosamine 2-epimerase (non-hydrolysing)